jgi:hypothetical protein
MDDLTTNRLTPSDEDPVVHSFLVALPKFSPVPDFSDRVLLRVWRPVPRRLRKIQTAVTESRWPWLAAGTLAAGALLWQAAVARAVAQHPEWADSAVNWIAARALPVAWATTTGFTADRLAAADAWVQTAIAGGLAVWAAAGLAVLAISTVGLLLTLRLRPLTRGGIHAAR